MNLTECFTHARIQLQNPKTTQVFYATHEMGRSRLVFKIFKTTSVSSGAHVTGIACCNMKGDRVPLGINLDVTNLKQVHGTANPAKFFEPLAPTPTDEDDSTEYC